MDQGDGRMTKIIGIHWPIVFVITGALYVLTIITLPFNPQLATVFLFAIVAYWSRLPGVGIPSPFFVLYQADIVDMLSMIVAINISGPAGAAFTIFCNLTSRMAGIFPKWAGVINDASSQAVMCLFMPLVHSFTQNVFVDMMIYTIARRLGFIVGWFIFPVYGSFAYFFFVLWPGATAVALLINGFYAKYFGFYFDSVMRNGVAFNWPMFIVVTIIVVLVWQMMTGKKASKYLHQGALLKAAFKKIEGEKKEEKKQLTAASDEEMVASVKGII